MPCISRFPTKAFQCGTDPHPVHVCRLTPPRPNAAGISVAPGTLLGVTMPLLVRCGLEGLAIQNQLGIEFSRPPTRQHRVNRSIADTEQIGKRAQIGRERHDRANVQITIRPPIQTMPDAASGRIGTITPAQSFGAVLSTVEWHNAHWIPTD